MQIITITIDARQTPTRLDVFLASHVPNFSRTQAQKVIEAGLVEEGDRVIERSNYKVVPGTTLTIRFPHREQVVLFAQDIPLDILYEDDDVLVINKPAGMVVHPAFGNWNGTLANAVLHHMTVKGKAIANDPQSAPPEENAEEDLRPGIIHRLDKDTSGIMVVALSPAAKAMVQKQFANRTIQKFYIALVVGKITPDQGMIDAPIDRDRRDRKKMSVSATGKIAQTSYQVLEHIQSQRSGTGTQSYTLVKALLHTGRTHQIRVHFASIGHPIVGDRTYGREDPVLPRQFLHAYSLSLTLPNGEKMTFEAPLSPDLLEYLKKLSEYPPSDGRPSLTSLAEGGGQGEGDSEC